MNEWITALEYSPDKGTSRQTTLAIPRCSVNSELGSEVECHEISPGKRAPATQEGGPCGQAYGGKWLGALLG
jgi:hypothetical protein